MQTQTPLCQRYREGCRMRPLPRAALDGFIRHEPRVAPAAPVEPFDTCAIFAAVATFTVNLRVLPARDVALIGIGHADALRTPLDWHLAGLGEMKHVFVAIVAEAPRVDRLEMPRGNLPPDRKT